MAKWTPAEPLPEFANPLVARFIHNNSECRVELTFSNHEPMPILAAAQKIYDDAVAAAAAEIAGSPAVLRHQKICSQIVLTESEIVKLGKKIETLGGERTVLLVEDQTEAVVKRLRLLESEITDCKAQAVTYADRVAALGQAAVGAKEAALHEAGAIAEQHREKLCNAWNESRQATVDAAAKAISGQLEELAKLEGVGHRINSSSFPGTVAKLRGERLQTLGTT